MPVSSLRFRIEGDNASALRSISDVRRAAENLGQDLQRHIGDKLKGVFSVTVIEEVVRRTADWATDLQKSARQLRINGETMQTLQVMAERAGISTDKLFSFYNKLEAAAMKAKTANDKYGLSFQKLGISWDKLKGPNRLGTVELGHQMLLGLSRAGGPAAFQQLIGGKSFMELSGLAREAAGRTLPEYQEAHKSQIVGETTTAAMAASWMQIKKDLTSLGNKLKPLVAAVLSIVDGLLKMVNGAIGTILGQWNDIRKVVGGDMTGKDAMTRWGSRMKAMGAGLVNIIPETVMGGINLVQQGIGMKPTPNTIRWNPNFKGLSKEEKREAMGAGEGGAFALSFGAGPAAKALGLGAKGVEATAGLVGAEGTAAKAGAFAGKMGAAGAEESLAMKGLLGLPTEKLLERVRSWVAANTKAGGLTPMFDKFSQEMGLPAYEDLSKVDKDAMRDLLMDKIMKMPVNRLIGVIGKTGVAGSLAAAGGIGVGDIQNSPFMQGGAAGAPDRTARFPVLKLGNEGGGGSGNLAVGGVFGVDIQSKILDLNGQMVDLLQQIVENTAPDLGGGVASDESGGAGM